MAGRAPRSGAGADVGLRVLVVDDEQPALAELAYLVRRDPSVAEVAAAANAEDALRHVGTGRFDAVLTDVQMPGFDGLALARAVARLARPPTVVFVTAYEEHAVAAFDLDVADYVLKPVRAERLAEALRRVRAPLAGGNPGAATDDDERVAVDLGGVTRFVRRAAVEWVEAHGDYVRLHLAGEAHLVRVPLGTLEERWAGAGFARAHRSVLVNLGHVREVRSDAGRWSVVTTGGARLPVSRRQARELRTALAAAVGGAPGRGGA
ncbi:MAG: LytR/AlgR family response regulator transcription factor [Kineosporiaceae bacterium]